MYMYEWFTGTELSFEAMVCESRCFEQFEWAS